MKVETCAYCMKHDNPELYKKFGYYAFDMKTSTVFVFKEQTKYGRVIVAYNDHVSEMCELTKEERVDFIEDVNAVAAAMHKAFNPDKINYGAYGDTGGHLHFHLCPKYKGGDEWGGIFQMNTHAYEPSDDVLEEIKNKLIAAMDPKFIVKK